MDDVVSLHLQELRRGTVVLAVPRLLGRPGCGCGLLQELGRRGFDTDTNTLHPLLRRLQKQVLLSGEWNTDQTRPRTFYRTSFTGRGLADACSEYSSR